MEFSERQTSWMSYYWRTSVGDLEISSDDGHPSYGGNRPSSHTINPIGGLEEDWIQPPYDTEARRKLNWQYERSSLNDAVS